MTAPTRCIRAILIQNGSIAGALSSPTGHRIRLGDASEIDQPPYILLWSIFDRPQYHLAGVTSTRIAMVQIDCYARTRDYAAQLAAATQHALHAFGRAKSAEVDVIEMIVDDIRQTDQRDRQGADQPLAVSQLDVRLTYRDTLPPTLSSP